MSEEDCEADEEDNSNEPPEGRKNQPERPALSILKLPDNPDPFEYE